MTAIVPRWEWRTFGTRFGIAESRFAELTPTARQDSDEIYFLGGKGAIAKVRGGLMDIKVLRDVDAHGLERWEPVLKQSFPLSAEVAVKVCTSLSLAAPHLGRDTYTLDQFVDEVAASGGMLRPVKVHKHRVRYTVGGCAAEFTDVQTDVGSSRTIAIESEDAQAVVAAIASVGLGDYLNMNYPLGLQALPDRAPERYAVIDVGTNSVKLHVGERNDDGTWHTIVDRAAVTRLGEGLAQSGEIAAEAAKRTADAIVDMVGEAKGRNVRAIAAVGTAGLRMASNGPAVVDTIRTQTGLSIEVISGDEESRLAYLAVVAGLGVPQGPLVVFDTGGGSTQFTFGQGNQVEERFSVNIGAARYTELFGLARAVPREALTAVFAAIAADLSRIDERRTPDALAAMGGAVTNMAAVKHGLTTYDADIVQGTALDRAEIDRQIELFRSLNATERSSIVGLQPQRAEVILAGACIVRTIMGKLDAPSLTVSDRGLRHGVLIERFGG